MALQDGVASRRHMELSSSQTTVGRTWAHGAQGWRYMATSSPFSRWRCRDILQNPAHGCRSSIANIVLLVEGHSYSFSSVASTVAVAPALTVMVLSQVLKPDFPSLILWSPTASRSDEGVLPMNFSSTVISAPSGVDFISTVESAAVEPFSLCTGVASVGD